MIWSKRKFADKPDFIKKNFMKNGYPEDVITKTIK